MRTHPHLVHPRQQSYVGQTQQQQSSYGQQSSRISQEMQQQQSHHYGAQDPYKTQQKRPFGSAGSYLPQQRSFSSSEEDLRSTPELEGEFFVLAFLLFFMLSVFAKIL